MDARAALRPESADRLVGYARFVIARAHAAPEAATVRRTIRLPFLQLDASFTDAGYAAHCDRALAPAAGDPGAAKASVAIVDAPAVGLTPQAWWEDILFPLEFEQRLAAAGLRGGYYADDRLWHFYDIAGAAGAALMREPGAYPPWEASAPLRPFLHWIYAEMGMRLIHAATLGRNGRGVLLAGSGGAGKSGTTVAGILAGLDSVGDDYVLFDQRNATAYPLFRIMKQDPAGFARLGLARFLGDPGPVNWQNKHEFDFADLGRGGRAAKLRIGALLVARIAGGSTSRIVPIGPRDAMLALAPSGIFQMPGERGSGAAFFARIVRSLPAYRLELGSDAGEIGETLSGFVERLPA